MKLCSSDNHYTTAPRRRSVNFEEDFPLPGFWTSNVKYEAVVQEYLPANLHQPADYALRKEYQGFVVKAILLIYGHSDGMV